MEPARQVDDDHENEPASKANLRAIEGGGQTTDPRSGHLQPVSQPENSVYDKNDEKAVVRPDLKKQEETGAVNSNGTPGDLSKNQKNESRGKTSKSSNGGQSGSNQESSSIEGGGLYNEEGDQSSSRLGRLRSKAKSGSKSKWFVGGALGATSMLTILIIALIILAGAYKIVDFAEHVAAYQFARTTTQMAEDSTNITDEAVDIAAIPDDTAGNSLIGALKDKYDTATGQVGDLWSKFDKYRPAKTISNFEGDGILKFNTSQTKLGRSRIDSVSINDDKSKIYSTAELDNGFKANHIPGFKFSSDYQYSKDFAPDLIDALKANDIGPITRARIASQIRSDLDVGLVAWIAGKYNGRNQDAADAETERESAAAAQGQNLDEFDNSSGATANVSTANGDSSGINAAAGKTETALEDELTNDAPALVKSPNTTPPEVTSAIASAVSEANITGLNGILGHAIEFVNPVYKYAVPLCLIYDGSIQHSGSAINEQSDQLEREAIWTQAAAAQEKDGSTATGQAVGSVDWKLGDITASNGEMRSSGIPVNTSTTLSTEASPTGQYTYTVADYLPGIGSLIDDLSPTICSTLTNTYVGIGVGAVGLTIVAITSLLTGGATTVAEGAADAGGAAGTDAALSSELSLADASTESADAASGSSSMLSKILGKAQGAGSYATDFAKDTAKQALAIGSLTLLAKQLVVAEMGGSHSPTATGTSFDNGVDDGTNLYANQIEQKQFYGAPMTDADLGPDNTANQAQLAENESRESTYDRFASINNPNSLVSNLAVKVDGYANGSMVSSFEHLLGGILSPLRSLGDLFSSISSKEATAATPITSDNTYYGNVQFGFTQKEKALLDSCPQGSHDPDLCSYQPLENQKILDESGNESSIASEYGLCFTDSIGTLLQNGDIQRSQDGDVIANQGLCSPDNLGPDSPDPLAVDADSTSPNQNDMIFRWRVAQGYNNTLNQLTDEQTVTASGTSTTSTPKSVCNFYNTGKGYFQTQGSNICYSSTNQYVPYGVSVIDDLDQPLWSTPSYESASDAQIQAAAQYWHTNSIRLQVSETNIMTDPSPGLSYNLTAMKRLGTEVNEILNENMVPIINDNLQRTNPAQLGPTTTTIAFWTAVTQYFSAQNNPAYSSIIFDIFNEPNTDWPTWEAGGDGYVSMQDVVNAIRGTSNALSNNLIMVEGPEFATTLAKLDQYPVAGTNLAFAYHHVNFTGPISDWEKDMGLELNTSVPIIDGEWAQYESTRPECYPAGPQNINDYFSTLLTNHVGLIFWSLEPGVGTQATSPQPISDIITPAFPTTAAGYSQPNTISSNYSCANDNNGNLLGQGVGSDIMSYFQQNSQLVPVNGDH
jgi:hypothetical protein